MTKTEITGITHKDIEDWMHAKRLELGAEQIGFTASKYDAREGWNSMVTEDYHNESWITFEKATTLIEEYSPRGVNEMRIAELEAELERLKQ